MGSGKSHAGKELAELLKHKFIDTDEFISSTKKKSIEDIFRKKGEDYFRTAEKKSIREISKKRNIVVATGGGLPCFHSNMEFMNSKGITIYLQASPPFLFHRLFKEKKSRPLISSLSDIELLDFITNKLMERKTFYEQAHIIVDAEKLNIKKLKEKILRFSEKA
jgi:shikimate kinase